MSNVSAFLFTSCNRNNLSWIRLGRISLWVKVTCFSHHQHLLLSVVCSKERERENNEKMNHDSWSLSIAIESRNNNERGNGGTDHKAIPCNANWSWCLFVSCSSTSSFNVVVWFTFIHSFTRCVILAIQILLPSFPQTLALFQLARFIYIRVGGGKERKGWENFSP